jgi:hypothetical protein
LIMGKQENNSTLSGAIILFAPILSWLDDLW